VAKSAVEKGKAEEKGRKEEKGSASGDLLPEG